MTASPHKQAVLFDDIPLTLACGAQLSPVPVAYETYGQAYNGHNAILVCHALTGDQYVAGPHALTGRPGWWENTIGPGKAIDTNVYHIVCSNILAGCMGTLGPGDDCSSQKVTLSRASDIAATAPATMPETPTHSANTGPRPFGTTFPIVTMGDIVRVQKALLDHLGIDKLFMVVGGSMGGMQVQEWLVRFSPAVYSAVLLATSSRHSAQNIALHELGRQAILADPAWQDGTYTSEGPIKGLSIARMAAHISYLSEDALTRKFGRNLQDRDSVSFGFDADFQVESYLRYQGLSFTSRFDARSYLYITRAMDYFDLSQSAAPEHGATPEHSAATEHRAASTKDTSDAARPPVAAGSEAALARAFAPAQHVRTLVASFTSDWLYPTSESKRIVRAMAAAGLPVSFTEIESDKGHDAFLLDEPELDGLLRGFVSATQTAYNEDSTHAAANSVANADGTKQATNSAPLPPLSARPAAPSLRPDLAAIAERVMPGSRVLEVGCGDGALLSYLATSKGVHARGLEINQPQVNQCVARGLFVTQGDADTDLHHFPTASFDTVILARTLQAVKRPDHVLRELARIGKNVLVSIPNFGHVSVRLSLSLSGRMPMTAALNTPWYATENIHFSTIKDLDELIASLGLKVADFVPMGPQGTALKAHKLGPNWRAHQALFHIQSGEQ